MNHDPSDLGLMCLGKKRKIKIQSWTFLIETPPPLRYDEPLYPLIMYTGFISVTQYVTITTESDPIKKKHP